MPTRIALPALFAMLMRHFNILFSVLRCVPIKNSSDFCAAQMCWTFAVMYSRLASHHHEIFVFILSTQWQLQK